MSYDGAMLFHVITANPVLILFWRALLTRKGSRDHKRAGRLVLILLGPLLLSVAGVTWTLGREGGPARVFQLAYLGLVVVTAGWTAWSAIRNRRDPERFRGPVFRLLATSFFASGVALLAVGVVRASVLAVGFSVMGIVYGGAMLGFPGCPVEAGWWLHWHLNGAALLLAAVHASFVSLLLRTALPESSGETVHALAQLGTIAFAYGFRQWLGHKYAGTGRPLHVVGRAQESSP